MTEPLRIDDAPFYGKTSMARPALVEKERRVECRRCGSSLQGRLERRYVRATKSWPYQELVEVFLCPCRKGTRRSVTRPLEEAPGCGRAA